MEKLNKLLQMTLDMVGPNPYLQAAIIIVVALLLAQLVQVLICRGVGRWANRTNTNIDDEIIAAMHRPLFMTVLLVGLSLAAMRLPLDARVESITISLLKTFLVWYWAIFGVRFSRIVLNAMSRNRGHFQLVEIRTLPLLQNLARVLIFAAAVYAFMRAWSIDVTAWVASAGIIGLALSFAAKDTLANIFAGVSIVADNPYKVGDYVVLDSGERGQVTQIGIRSSRILTRDDVEVTIPNSVMGNAKIYNESGGPHEKFRIRVKVSVAYGSDLDDVNQLLAQIAAAHPDVCDQPAPRVRVRELGESGVNIELLVWVARPVLRGRVLHELNMSVYRQFTENGIEIPYPKQDLYVRHMPGEAG